MPRDRELSLSRDSTHSVNSTSTDIRYDPEEGWVNGVANGSTHNYEYMNLDDNVGAPRNYCFNRLTKRSCYVLSAGLVLFFGAVTAVLLLVLGPYIAKQEVLSSVITFDQVNITRPDSGGDGPPSIFLSVLGTVSKAGPLSGYFEKMTTSISFQGKHLATVTLPTQQIAAGAVNKVAFASEFIIDDVTVFNNFTTALINADQLTWHMSGKASVGCSFLPFAFHGIPFEKDILLLGIGGFKNVSLDVFDLSHSTNDEAIIFLQANVYNPSVTQIIPLGDLNFDVFFNGTVVGHLHAVNQSLLHGSNLMPMKGVLRKVFDDRSRRVASQMMSQYLGGIDTLVVAKASYPNASSIPLYNHAMKDLALHTILHAKSTPIITNMVCNSITMAPKDNLAVALKIDTQVDFTDPLGNNSLINVSMVSMSSDIIDGEDLHSHRLGHLTTQNIPVHGNQTSVTVSVPLSVQTPLLMDDLGVSLSAFLSKFIYQDHVIMQVNGRTKVAASPPAIGSVGLDLPINIPIQMAGLGGLKQNTIEEFKIVGDAPTPCATSQTQCGVLVQITASLVNPSAATMPLGNISFDMYAGGVRQGDLHVVDFTLVPGPNVLHMFGTLLPAPSALNATSTFVTNYLTGVDQAVKVTGTQADGSLVQWLQKTIRNMTMSTTLKGIQNNQLITNTTIISLGMQFPKGSDQYVGAAHITIMLHLPDNLRAMSINVELVESMSVTLNWRGKDFASMDIRNVPVKSYDPQTRQVEVEFTGAPLVVLDAGAFSDFVGELLVAKSIDNITVTGAATTQISTAMGKLIIGPAAVHNEGISIVGMNGFQDPPLKIEKLDIVGGHGGRSEDGGILNMLLNYEIYNPSPITTHLLDGKLDLDMYYKGFKLGTCHHENFLLVPGWNVMSNVTVTWQPKDVDSAKEALSQYLSYPTMQVATPISIHGTTESTDVAVLKPAFAKLSSATKLYGIKQYLLGESQIDLPHLNIIKLLADGLVPIKLSVLNPFSQSLEFLATGVHITLCSKKGGNLDCDKWGDHAFGIYTQDDLSKAPLFVPSGKSELPDHNVDTKHMATLGDYLAITAQGTFTHATIKVHGPMTARVGGENGFVLDIEYTQDHMDCVVHF
jgi:hypothetical protein